MTASTDSEGDLATLVAQWAAAGEQYEVEFKGELHGKLNDRDLVEAVVCLANGRGGVLLVGVEDDGTVTGARYRALAAPAGYVRIRGFEPLQQEQMVLQYVDAHGRITRSEAADLCALTSEQASRLLRRLAGDGKLEVRGEGRGTRYVKPAGPERG